MCTRAYTLPMEQIGARELRANLAAAVRQAGAGERVVITIDGRPVDPHERHIEPLEGERMETRAALRQLELDPAQRVGAVANRQTGHDAAPEQFQLIRQSRAQHARRFDIRHRQECLQNVASVLEVGADGQVVPRQEDVVTRTATGTEGEVAGLDVGDGVTLPQKPKKVNTVTIKPGETITADPAASADGGEDDAIPGISIAESVEQPPAIPAKKKKAAASVLEVPASEEAAAQEVVTAGEQETADVVQPVKKKKKKAVAEEQVALAEASAPAEPTATTQPASGGNGYVVQVRASKSRVDALGSFADLQQKYAELLGSTQPDIQQVDLGGTKGVWYRLRLGPPGSRKAAVDLCGKLKSQGLKECLVAAY